jgi:hypothetical protein
MRGAAWLKCEMSAVARLLRILPHRMSEQTGRRIVAILGFGLYARLDPHCLWLPTWHNSHRWTFDLDHCERLPQLRAPRQVPACTSFADVRELAPVRARQMEEAIRPLPSGV